MSAVTPTVTGTVTSYTVVPSLPAGVNLNASTGSLSGTPTAVAATANYTVTASNAGGSTTATVAITVNNVAPSITYAITSLTLTRGAHATDLAPTNSGGAAVTWSISPALLNGLTFSTTTGTIGGTPTAASAPATYTVTATNSGGSGAATLTIGVQSVLVDLGHTGQINWIRVTNSRVLTADTPTSMSAPYLRGAWVLWNYSTAARVAGGPWVCASAACVNGRQAPVDLAGPIVVDETSAGLEIRSASDGSLLATVTAPLSWWKLATDGSYVCGGGQWGLTVWSTSGTVITTRAGDYSKAVAFAAAGQVQVALGAAGSNVIETLALPSGAATTSSAFSGNFQSWFIDGQRFLTLAGSTATIYSGAAVQQDIKAFTATPTQLAGQGGWFWDLEAGGLAIYKVGASATPSATYATNGAVSASGSTIGMLSYATGASVVDLSGATPTKADFATPVQYNTAYAALSASTWLLGNTHGAVLDGASLTGTARYFGYGAAWSIAGSAPTVAVATASGSILLFDANTGAPQTPRAISFSSSEVALSSDGSVLAAAADQLDAQYHPDRTVNVYSLPATSVINSWPYTWPTPTPANTVVSTDAALSASGTMLGQVRLTLNANGLGGTRCSRQVTAVTGGAPVWSDTQACLPVRLSPDGTHVAVSSSQDSVAGTNIYKNGTLVVAVPGWAVGWVDDNRLLVNNYQAFPPGYTHATIYGSDGTRIGDVPTLPELSSLQTVAANLVYDRKTNRIYSLTSGMATWSSASPTLQAGAIAGSNVVFASGSQVLMQPY